MAILSYLQGLGATHLFTLDNVGTSTTDDEGNSSIPTNITGGTYTFQTDPVCEGVTYSLDVVASTGNGTDGAVFANRNDINSGTPPYNTGTRTVILWFKQAVIQNPTCIYEQGGGANNFAFMGGALTTWQAADSGQPFLIAQGRSLAQANRPYFLCGVWQHHTQHSGSGNRIIFYINGVEQSTIEDTGTDSFPPHSGDIALGNSGESLRSFAGTTFTSQTTDKNCNFLGMYNNVTLTQAECREIFERTTFSDETIVADTVANQQAALDALSGNTYENTNCAIRIIQATDATNYRLFIDNITFNADANLEDISIQFVGTGILTVEDTNGTVIQYTSAPPEIEQTSSTLTGGGSVTVINNTIRYTSNDTITNSNASKLVFDGNGTAYTVSGGTIPEFENVSGSTVLVTLTNGAPTPTLTETNGSITLTQNVSVTAANLVDDTRVQLYNVTKAAELDNSVVSGGGGYLYTANLLSSDVDNGDTLRIRAVQTSGATAKAELENTGTITISGLAFLNTQSDNDVYNTLALNGSTITKFSADYADNEVDIIVGSNFELAELYAWWVYNLTTSQGVSDFWNGVTAVDSANFKINNSVVDINLDNTTTTNVFQTDNRRLYRADLARPVKNPTTGNGGIDVEWRSPVSLANIDSFDSKIDTIDANVDAILVDTGTTIPAQITALNDPSLDEIADAVWDEASADHVATGSTGEKLKNAARDAQAAVGLSA